MSPKLDALLRTAVAGALGAIAPILPDVLGGLPDGTASVLTALVAMVLLHVRAPADRDDGDRPTPVAGESLPAAKALDDADRDRP